ncbi:malto-oligosyltrehalose synthase [bacterium F11]|nr:malto-oligosyltrehalose synthase [bacterium F11]
MRHPISTYRFQFNSSFTFQQAESLLDYLGLLGITDIYSSPILQARKDSVHGYDCIDPTTLNKDIGTEEDFNKMADALKEKGMGLIVDIVPNHMCITDSLNLWWMDVLENGPSSKFSKYFDINWKPTKAELKNKVLLPFLGDQYGRVIENQEIQLSYQDGAFFSNYYDYRLPLAPKTWVLILEPLLNKIKSQIPQSEPHLRELESIVTALNHLPDRTEKDVVKMEERYREKDIIKDRLSKLINGNTQLAKVLQNEIRSINGSKDNPHSFNRLEELLREQAYRLSFWRVAADEINYRRFFDINDLAAIRVEEPEVFEGLHRWVLEKVKQGRITGFRIDHVDGLFSPQVYLEDLQRHCLDHYSNKNNDGSKDSLFYVVVEKILEGKEELKTSWPIFGTTGYDFMNTLNELFIHQDNRKLFQNTYRNFTGQNIKFNDLLCSSKKFIMLVSNASELTVLAHKLDTISEQHRYSRDFTLDSLKFVLREVIACFPVYRSYTTYDNEKVDGEDREHIEYAIHSAKQRNLSTDPSLFDFVGDVLLMQDPPGLNSSQITERREFVMRFQQITGPIMAKGLEDTAFYRYFPLASQNEVGGNPDHFGIPLEEFHRRSIQRQMKWPGTLNATTTHDTKRSEDVRARINVLSEIPAQWHNALTHWHSLNADKKKTIDGIEAPDSNEEYLLYQTLIGTWPYSKKNDQEYEERIGGYMVKALREAKNHSSWLRPNESYEKAILDFINDLLNNNLKNKFLESFESFIEPIIKAGILNSLCQTVLKVTSPGIPDFYQGTEVWNLSLVDPDNRRPVDYDHLRGLLTSFDGIEDDDVCRNINEMISRPEDGKIKLYVTKTLLQLRRREKELFVKGKYIPLTVTGPNKKQVCAFARECEEKKVVVVVSRFYLEEKSQTKLTLPKDWGDTFIQLPMEWEKVKMRDVLTKTSFEPESNKGEKNLSAALVLNTLPAAVLENI